MRQVLKVPYIYSQTIIQYYSLNLLQFLCHTYQLHVEPAKSRKKANLSLLVSHADLSWISLASRWGASYIGLGVYPEVPAD